MPMNTLSKVEKLLSVIIEFVDPLAVSWSFTALNCSAY
jgi:hypothetical protein